MMRRLIALGLPLACAAAFVAQPAAAASSPSSLPTVELESVVDGLLDEGAPGGVLAARTADGPTGVARGKADIRTGRKARPHHRYRIGSNTKTMVATVALQLVHEGRLGLDDRVAGHLPRLGLDDRITVRHLLQHTSGFYYDTMLWKDDADYAENRFRHFEPAELVKIALTNPKPRPAPGTTWEYSNTNYILAGMVIEKVTGRSVRHELRTRIFRPLGLTGTSLPTDRPFITGSHLRGYRPGEKRTDTTVYGMSWAWTAGAAVSTATDETAFLRALFTGRLLPRPLLDEMLDTSEHRYGLGVVPIRLPCEPGMAYGHDGAVFGYHSATVSTADGSRQVALGVNTWLLDENGNLSTAVVEAAVEALCAT